MPKNGCEVAILAWLFCAVLGVVVNGQSTMIVAVLPTFFAVTTPPVAPGLAPCGVQHLKFARYVSFFRPSARQND